MNENIDDITLYSAAALARKVSHKIHKVAVQTLINQLNGRDYHRAENFVTRKAIQQKILNLPLYPTTTTGSFPQTGDIRVIRAKWRRQEITDAEYKAYIPLI